MALIKKFEDHPELPKFLLDPSDWDEELGEPWFDVPFVYIDPEHPAGATPSAKLLELSLKLDEELTGFVLHDNGAPNTAAVMALHDRGVVIKPHIEVAGEWLSSAWHTRHGPYIFD